jgi:protein ImuB
MKSPQRYPPQTRYLCLWFPEWPLQRFIAAHPDYQRQVVLLTQRNQRGEFVVYRNAFSAKLGICSGMPLSEAQTFIRPHHRVVVEPIQPDHDQQALVQVALRCERFSFCIGLEDASPPECLVMDVTGLAHFFSGEQALAKQLGERLAEEHFDSRIAIAWSIGSAWAAAHFLARPKRPAVMDDSGTIDTLPVAGLRLSNVVILKLHRLGLATIGQILALDRASLVRRFGLEVLLRIDQLLGQESELITPCRPPPRFEIAKTFGEDPVPPQAIEPLWSMLLQKLLAALQPKRLGTRAVACRFALEDRTSISFVLRLCDATNDFGHLSDLFRLQLEQWRFTAPVVGLSLEALDVRPLEQAQQELAGSESRDDARQFGMLINRLSSRLGEETVVAPHLLPDPIPERATLWVPATDQLKRKTFSVAPYHVWDRPTVLFSEPRPIEVVALFPDGPPRKLLWHQTRFEIAAAWGPERIERGWWQAGSVCRDYYCVETSAGRWLWVFRQHQDGQWFWHGEM